MDENEEERKKFKEEMKKFKPKQSVLEIGIFKSHNNEKIDQF